LDLLAVVHSKPLKKKKSHPFLAKMQVSLHTKKFKHIPSLVPYLLTDFFDLKTANSSIKTAAQC
jgi:hypothetical protein